MLQLSAYQANHDGRWQKVNGSSRQSKSDPCDEATTGPDSRAPRSQSAAAPASWFMRIQQILLPSVLIVLFQFSFALPSSGDLAGLDDRFGGRSLQSPEGIIDAVGLQSSPNLRKRQGSSVGELLSALPIPISAFPTYHLKLTSHSTFYHADSAELTPAYNASAPLSSFYGSVVSRSTYFARQNRDTKTAMAFGAKRMWIDFYGSAEEGLRWQDVEWVATRARGWAEKGLVGVWEGVLWPQGQKRQVRVHVKVIP
ncbi:MAG: hypothetical protein Q9173_004980 [Seirophora scorigena]